MYWPRELFAPEFVLHAGPDTTEQRERTAFLLEEAFRGDTGHSR